MWFGKFYMSTILKNNKKARDGSSVNSVVASQLLRCARHDKNCSFTLGWKKSTTYHKCLAKFGKYCQKPNVSEWPTQLAHKSESFSIHIFLVAQIKQPWYSSLVFFIYLLYFSKDGQVFLLIGKKEKSNFFSHFYHYYSTIKWQKDPKHCKKRVFPKDIHFLSENNLPESSH